MSLTDAKARLDAVALELAELREIRRRRKRDTTWQDAEDAVECSWQGLSSEERAKEEQA